MILLLHMRIHLVTSSIPIIIMILTPIAIMMLHLRLWTLPIQSIIVITFNKFHYEVLSNMLFVLVSKHLHSSSKVLVWALVIRLILLRYVNFSVTFVSNLLDSFCPFANYETYHLIWNVKFKDFVFVRWCDKWIVISHWYLHLWIRSLFLNSDYFINHFFSFTIFIIWSFHKNVSAIGRFNFFDSHLNLSSTLCLKLSYRISSFSNNKTNNVIWNRNNICTSIRWTIWRHHGIINFEILPYFFINLIEIILLVLLRLISQLSCNWKLLLSNFISSFFIWAQDSIHDLSGFLHVCRCFTNNKNMLIVFIVWLWSWTLFLRSFTSD